MALARSLVADGVKVFGSTTRRERFPEIRTLGAIPVLLEEFESANEASFWDTDALLVSLPSRALTSLEPLLRRLTEKGWRDRALILLSSTSVFGRDQGEVDERTEPQPTDERGRTALAIEKGFRKHFPQATILRLGGLVGPGRHPGEFLSGRKNLPDGDSPVNLIHRDDAVGILRLILERDIRGEILHGVCDERSTRAEFYRDAALSLGLTPPDFVASKGSTKIAERRRIKNDALKSKFGFRFRYPVLRSESGLVEGAMSKFEELDLFGDCYTARFTPGERTSEAVLFLHGFPAEVGNKNIDLAEDLTSAYSVDTYILHYAGLGKSRGRFSFERAIQDATAYARHLLASFGYKKLHLVGHSWGSFVSINVYEKLGSERGAMALLAPFSHIPPGGAGPFADYFLEKNPHIFSTDMRDAVAEDLATVRDRYSPVAAAARLASVPGENVLVVHALHDDVIPLSTIQTLVDAFPNRPLYAELDTDHRFFANRDSLLVVLREFFARFLKGAGHEPTHVGHR